MVKVCFDRYYKKIYVGISAIKASAKVKKKCNLLRTHGTLARVHEVFG